MSAARPGDVVIFTPGTYGHYGDRTVWRARGTTREPITFTGEPNAPRPVILGYNKVQGEHLRLRGLRFLGPTGQVHPRSSQYPTGQEVLIWFAGPDQVLSGSEVAGDRWHAGIYINGPGNVRIVGNYIHDNGDFSRPDQANIDHGIYWGAGTGGLIADNLIVHNLAMGIQIYPSGSHVLVEQNTIVGNGKSGVILANGASYDTVINNIVVANSDNSIRSFDLSGGHDLVENNLVWKNGNGNLGTDADGLRLVHNIRADPQFVGPNDYRLQPCSPAVGRAIRTSAMLSYDISGAARNPRPDVGAYQDETGVCAQPRRASRR